MPCFKGLAVSIHTPKGPLPEHSVQKASRLSRISAYIPVPPPHISSESKDAIPEQSTFAISITLLTPGQDVPYSMPKSNADNPNPKPKVVGGLPGHGTERGKYTGAVGPYVPLTTSPNETIAAYIYFDGRGKEEVATLLRKGEETWVNSRWVGVPESEGGGLAEREFVFREVGLERWLNGLDLEGKDAAATIERRRQKMEKRRRRRKETTGSDDELNGDLKPKRKSTMRYSAEGELEDVSDDDESLSDSNTSEDDDDPIPETAGQIKVALFRVLASGEIKRGEYSPQFDAHDDDDAGEGGAGGANGADVDHQTGFAKPKPLDPKTISTQTVTGIDPTDKPYAVFTFLYRGERQLQKMGILRTKAEKTPAVVKRRSLAMDIPNLGPLKKQGTMGFAGYRESKTGPKQKKNSTDDMESESEEEDGALLGKMDDVDDADVKKETGLLSPEDAERTGQVAEGIRKMKLKRQHSAEPLNSNGTSEAPARKSSKSGSPSASSTPRPEDQTASSPPNTSGVALAAPGLSSSLSTEVKNEDDGFMVGSPLKKQRASMADFDDDFKRRLGGAMSSGRIGEVLGIGDASQTESPVQETATNGGLHFGEALRGKRNQPDDDEQL